MNYLKTYSNFLKSRLRVERPLKIVCDASNGTAGLVLKEVFKDSKIKIVLINGKLDGRFPAHGPNPLAKGALDEAVKFVKKEKADLGAVFDADGDRVFFIDDNGRTLPSFLTAMILFGFIKPPFVADEIIFQTIKVISKDFLKQLFPSKVGSFFVKEQMKKRKANISAEYSGHFYFKDFFNSDSGIFTLIKICNFLSSSKNKLSDFASKVPKVEIKTDEIKLPDKNFDWQKRALIYSGLEGKKLEKRDGLTFSFLEGFLNLRASNTESIVRLTCMSKKEDLCSEIISGLKKHLKV